MQQLQFQKNTIVNNLRELADKIESEDAEVQAGRYNVGQGFGLNVQPGWSIVIHIPSVVQEPQEGEQIAQVQHGYDVELTVQPSKQHLVGMAEAKLKEFAASQAPQTFEDENCKAEA